MSIGFSLINNPASGVPPFSGNHHIFRTWHVPYVAWVFPIFPFNPLTNPIGIIMDWIYKPFMQSILFCYYVSSQPILTIIKPSLNHHKTIQWILVGWPKNPSISPGCHARCLEAFPGPRLWTWNMWPGKLSGRGLGSPPKCWGKWWKNHGNPWKTTQNHGKPWQTMENDGYMMEKFERTLGEEDGIWWKLGDLI